MRSYYGNAFDSGDLTENDLIWDIEKGSNTVKLDSMEMIGLGHQHLIQGKGLRSLDRDINSMRAMGFCLDSVMT